MGRVRIKPGAINYLKKSNNLLDSEDKYKK
jgi:hypothetical protein